jgi:hypothetical protein
MGNQQGVKGKQMVEFIAFQKNQLQGNLYWPVFQPNQIFQWKLARTGTQYLP